MSEKITAENLEQIIQKNKVIKEEVEHCVTVVHTIFKRTNQNLYGSKKVNIPKPELYMIYTGDKK